MAKCERIPIEIQKMSFKDRLMMLIKRKRQLEWPKGKIGRDSRTSGIFKETTGKSLADYVLGDDLL